MAASLHVTLKVLPRSEHDAKIPASCCARTFEQGRSRVRNVVPRQPSRRQDDPCKPTQPTATLSPIHPQFPPPVPRRARSSWEETKREVSNYLFIFKKRKKERNKKKDGRAPAIESAKGTRGGTPPGAAISEKDADSKQQERMVGS